MQLSYRGVPYESTSLELPTLETGQTVHYRGVAYPLRHAPMDVPLRHSSGMVYRGVSTARGSRANFLGNPYYQRAIEFIPMPTKA